MHAHPDLAIIGGSGLYEMPGLEEIQDFELVTPFGLPSAPIIVGTLGSRRVAFLARHGLGHHISPSEINFRANIHALKSLGVERIVSISACGSLREDYAPGDIVVPDQLFDFTKGRSSSFFDDGFVVHINVADPFCSDLSQIVYESVLQTGAVAHAGRSFITIEGPRFSTKAESNVFRAWGMSIIGMTTSPEAYLAREAEICYAVMAHVTDYDVWHISEEPVTVDKVIEILNRNTTTAREAVRNIALKMPVDRTCDCQHALSDALITNKEIITSETRERLNLLVGKYIK